MIRAFRVFVGPTAVPELAERLRAAGVEVTCEGTEHIHFRVNDRGWGEIEAERVCEEAFGFRPAWVRWLREDTR